MIRALLSAAAVSLALGGAVSAATINFTSGGTGAAGLTGVGVTPSSYTSSASYTVGASVTEITAAPNASRFGLGVTSVNDNGLTPLGQQISGQRGSETLTVTFSWAVKLLNFTLGRVDAGDDFEVAYNGGAFVAWGPALALIPGTQQYLHNVGQVVSSFSIRAKDNSVGRTRDAIDNFTLAAANVAAVPVPAAGFMMLAGLAGLAALRRRKALV